MRNRDDRTVKERKKESDRERERGRGHFPSVGFQRESERNVARYAGHVSLIYRFPMLMFY